VQSEIKKKDKSMSGNTSTMFVMGTKGAQITAPMRQTPNVIRRPSTKKLILTSRNDNQEERKRNFGKLMSNQQCRPLQGSFPLSKPIQSVFSLKVDQFSLSASTLYNIHASYANDTLIFYRADLRTTQKVTISPGRYNEVGSVIAALNQAIPDQYLSFQWDESGSRLAIQLSPLAEQHVNQGDYPGIFIAEQYGGLAELLGFSAMDVAFYQSESLFYFIQSQGQLAGSPPKLWSFQYACLHVQDQVSNGQSDVSNEIMVSTTVNGLDSSFGYYYGLNSHDATEATTAAPRGFEGCLATAPLDMEDMTGQIRGGVISLHHNALTEGSAIDRTYTHQDAEQYNNKTLSSVVLSFTNEYGQLLIGPLTVDFGVTLEVTSK
jgi:hypothetical protein